MGLTQTRPSSHMPVASRRKLPAVRGERLDRVRMHVRRPKIPEATFSDPRLYMALAGGGHISCMLLAPLQKRFPHLLVPSITRWSRRFLRRMLRNPLTQLVRFRASIMAPTLQAMNEGQTIIYNTSRPSNPATFIQISSYSGISRRATPAHGSATRNPHSRMKAASSTWPCRSRQVQQRRGPASKGTTCSGGTSSLTSPHCDRSSMVNTLRIERASNGHHGHHEVAVPRSGESLGLNNVHDEAC